MTHRTRAEGFTPVTCRPLSSVVAARDPLQGMRGRPRLPLAVTALPSRADRHRRDLSMCCRSGATLCQGISRTSWRRDIPASGGLGVLRGVANSISRLHLPPYPQVALQRRDCSFGWKSPRCQKWRQRDTSQQHSLNPEATLSDTLLPLRIEAHQVLLDVRSNTELPVWYLTQDVLPSDLERCE